MPRDHHGRELPAHRVHPVRARRAARGIWARAGPLTAGRLRAGLLDVLGPDEHTFIDAHTLAFADVRGNRQLVSTGNLAHDARVALILVDYPRCARLKVLGRAAALDPREHPEFASQLLPAGHVERIVRIDVVGLDWNCPQNITPRYTEAEVEEYAAALRARIDDLEQRLAAPDVAPARPSHS